MLKLSNFHDFFAKIRLKIKQNLMEISNFHDFFAKIRCFRRTIFKGKCRLFTRKIERKLENKANQLGYFDGNFKFSRLFCQNTLRADLKFNPKVVFHIEFHGIFLFFKQNLKFCRLFRQNTLIVLLLLKKISAFFQRN